MSKLKVEKNKKGSWKSASVTLPEEKPVVLNDIRNKKGVGMVLVTDMEYDDAKMSVKLHGYSIEKKEPYKVSLENAISNEAIQYMSKKDDKILAQSLGKLSGLIAIDKKINKIAADRKAVAEEVFDSLRDLMIDYDLTGVKDLDVCYEKSKDKILKKFDKKYLDQSEEIDFESGIEYEDEDYEDGFYEDEEDEDYNDDYEDEESEEEVEDEPEI